jgi:hypothetical protein
MAVPSNATRTWCSPAMVNRARAVSWSSIPASSTYADVRIS